VLLEDAGDLLAGPSERPPVTPHHHRPPDPAGATGTSDPLAAPDDSRPNPTRTERAQ
jgi:hypothetical protein